VFRATYFADLSKHQSYDLMTVATPTQLLPTYFSLLKGTIPTLEIIVFIWSD
jgi:hypothetical protein